MKKVQIQKNNGKTNIFSIYTDARTEHYMAINCDDPVEMDSCIKNIAGRESATLLSRFAFAGIRHYKKFQEAANSSEQQLAWIQGDACKDAHVYSMQAQAISGIKPTPVRFKGKTTGFVYEDEYARYCRLAGISPQNADASRPEQVKEVFYIIAESLKEYGFAFTDTVRTWFYLDNILDWYKEFNIERTAFFEKTGIFSKMVPASTGIGAANQYGTALICDLIAVQPKTDKIKIQSVNSPMQGSALDYKSSFSRAVEILCPTHRQLFISGTASIAPDGKTVHLNDTAKQIDLTMQVVWALLKSRGMDWEDVSRGIAYLRNIEDRKLFEDYCESHKIPDFPLAVAHAAVCRGDLLFELEADAIKIN